MIRVVPKFQSGGQTSSNTSGNTGVSLKKYKDISEKREYYLSFDSQNPPKDPSFNRKLTEYSLIAQVPSSSGGTKTIYLKPEVAGYYGEFVKRMKGYSGDPTEALVEYANEKNLSPDVLYTLLKTIEDTTTYQGWAGTQNVDPYGSIVRDPETNKYVFRAGAGNNPSGRTAFGQKSKEALTFDSKQRTYDSQYYGAPGNKYDDYYKILVGSDNITEKFSTDYGIEVPPYVQRVLKDSKERGGMSEESFKVLSNWLRNSRLSKDPAFIDAIERAFVDWAGGRITGVRTEKLEKTGVKSFLYQHGGIIPKYSVVKKFRSGGAVPSFQEGGEMAAAPTEPGMVEEGAQVQGGEQIFSVEDTQQIIQMVQQILQTQDQRQQAELLMQLGLFVVEAVMRQMQAGEQTTTTNAPPEQPPTEPMGGGAPVQEAKTGGKLNKSIMDTY